MNITQSYQRNVKGLSDIKTVLEMLLMRSGLDHERASFDIQAVKPDLHSSGNFDARVQITSGSSETTFLKLVVFTEVDEPVTGIITYADEKGSYRASDLNQILQKAKGSNRFDLSTKEIKEHRRLQAEKAEGKTASNGSPKNGSDFLRRVETPFQVQPSPPPPESPPCRVEDDGAEGEESPGDTELLTNTLSMKNMNLLSSVLTALCVEETVKEVFDFRVLMDVLSTALGMPVTIGQARGILRTLSDRNYIEICGRAPSRYRVTDLAKKHAEDGVPPTDPLPETFQSRGLPLVANPFGLVEVKIRELESELAEKGNMATRMGAAKEEIRKREDALNRASIVDSEIRRITTEIGRLTSTLERLNGELVAIQIEQKLVAEGSEAVARLREEVSVLETKLARLVGVDRTLAEARQSLATLKQLMS